MIEQVYETGQNSQHYEFRSGHWWVCAQPMCDGTHHYYMAR